MYQNLNKFAVPNGFRGRSAIVVQIWWLVQSILFAFSPQPMYRWRNFLLRLFGAKIGKGVLIRSSARITYPWKVSIGDYSWVGDRAELYSLDRICIGEHSCISQDSYLCTGSHDYNREDFAYKCAPIVIGNEVWLSSGTFVTPGVVIEDAVVVGARSLVLKNLNSRGIYAGHPVKWIRERSTQDQRFSYESE